MIEDRPVSLNLHDAFSIVMIIVILINLLVIIYSVHEKQYYASLFML